MDIWKHYDHPVATTDPLRSKIHPDHHGSSRYHESSWYHYELSMDRLGSSPACSRLSVALVWLGLYLSSCRRRCLILFIIPRNIEVSRGYRNELCPYVRASVRGIIHHQRAAFKRRYGFVTQNISNIHHARTILKNYDELNDRKHVCACENIQPIRHLVRRSEGARLLVNMVISFISEIFAVLVLNFVTFCDC